MAERERTFVVALGQDREIPGRGDEFEAAVVVSGHDGELDGALGAPGGDMGDHLAGETSGGVQQVADDEDAISSCLVDGGGEAGELLGHQRTGKGDAVDQVGLDLAEVQIGDDERGTRSWFAAIGRGKPSRPEDGAVRHQFDNFTTGFHRDGGRTTTGVVGASGGRSFCIARVEPDTNPATSLSHCSRILLTRSAIVSLLSFAD